MRKKVAIVALATSMILALNGCGSADNGSRNRTKSLVSTEEPVSNPDVDEELKQKYANTEFSDDILVGISYGGAGYGTMVECLDTKVILYKDKGVEMILMSNNEPIIGTFSLSEEDYKAIESIVDPYEIATLNITTDMAVCDGNSQYLYVYDKDDNIIPKGGYMVSSERFGEIRRAIMDILDKYDVRTIIAEAKNKLEYGNSYEIPRDTYEYTVSGNPIVNTPVKEISIGKISENANDIIDTEDWFDKYEIPPIDDYYIIDDQYTYFVEQTSDCVPYNIIIYNEQFDTVATVDMTAYMVDEDTKPGDESYTKEGVTHVWSADNILYISVSHSTYAESAPHNAYIIALDMNNDFELIWQSNPLVCNASNFVVYDDFIFTGYGFTSEEDYLYILNRYNGEVIDRDKLKSKPEYMAIVDGMLLIRCYDTDYEYDMDIH